MDGARHFTSKESGEKEKELHFHFKWDQRIHGLGVRLAGEREGSGKSQGSWVRKGEPSSGVKAGVWGGLSSWSRAP